jgi:hypothetical protein
MISTLIRLTVICAAVAAGILLAARPWREMRAEEARTLARRAEMQSLMNERASLAEHRALNSTSHGRRELLRREGRVLSGETPLLLAPAD